MTLTLYPSTLGNISDIFLSGRFFSVADVDHVMKFVNCNPEDEFDYLCDLCDEVSKIP